jgi:hypothetical protein
MDLSSFGASAMSIRIHTTIQSDTLVLPELRQFIGQAVEIVIQPDVAKVAPSHDRYGAFFALVGQDVVDPAAYKQLRSASEI